MNIIFGFKKLFQRVGGLAGVVMMGVVVAGIPCARAEGLPIALPEQLIPELNVLLKSALEQSPTMLTNSLNLAQAEADIYSSRSGQLPSVNASAGYSIIGSKAQDSVTKEWLETTQSDGPTFSFSVNQPIYHWGALQAQTDISKLRRRITERQYRAAYATLVSSIRSQYLALIQKKKALANQRSNEESDQRFLQEQEKKLKEGRLSQGEIMDVRLRAEESTLATEKAQVEYDNSRALLATFAGVAKIDDVSVPLDVPKPLFAAETVGRYMDALRPTSLESFPEIENYRDQIKQSELQYKIAKLRLYPKLNANGSISQSAINSGTTITQTLSSSGFITANWTLFDGFSTRGAKISALTSKRQAEQGLATYQSALAGQISLLGKQISLAGRGMELVQKRADMAESAVSWTAEQVKLGRSSPTEVERATLAAQSAALRAMAARAEFLNKWVEYVSLLGVDPVMNNLPERFLRNSR